MNYLSQVRGELAILTDKPVINQLCKVSHFVPVFKYVDFFMLHIRIVFPLTRHIKCTLKQSLRVILRKLHISVDFIFCF